MKSFGKMFKRKKGEEQAEEEQQLQQQQSAESEVGEAVGADNMPSTAAFGLPIGEGVDLPDVDQSVGDSPPHHPPPPPPLPDSQQEGGGGGSEYPYLREMKERLLIAKEDPVMGISDQDNQLLEVHQTPVSTVVRLNADGYGSHTSPTHRVESLYTGTLESRRTHAHEFFPKNAKTSTFITLSLLYATLLIVVCLGFVLSEVLTHNVPLYYYEAFFTYLYGLSIFFLLYVFCYLLTDSSGEIKTPNTQVYMVRLSSLPFYSRVNPVSNSRASLYRSWLL